MQRADTFSIGSGTRDKRDIDDDIDEFDDAMSSVLKKAQNPETEPVEDEEKELAEHAERHAQMEAERRGSSSPSHQPFLGMSILPGITNPKMAVGEAPESHSKKRSAAVDEKNEARIETVSPELVQGLKKAGLSEPLITLDDPRIKGSAEKLSRDFVLSLASNERVYVWSQNRCHQILSIGLHESRLESAVDQTIETVTRRGRVDRKTIEKRYVSDENFELKDDV